MLSRARLRLNEESGFSLPELLVVILIIGILAALAIPQFLSQKDKSHDSSAKSNARNLATQVQACSTNPNATYTDCDEASELPNTGLKLGSGNGEVEVSSATADSFEVTAKSQVGHTFTFARSADGGVTRTCSPANKGGCNGGSW